mmetsp:Transcript_31236/g.89553  ORF Transcript_31236/g.89553 Transcript_31236/m.89553 type:complete len:1231 (-) Transcript_31236:33-3725(-)
MAMEFSLPGAVDAGHAPVPHAKNHRRQLGLRAKVWEYAASTWTVTHNFSMGLELDTATPSSRPGSRANKGAHLPSISVAALLQLRSALGHPWSLAMDRDAEQSDAEDSSSSAVFGLLVEQASEAIGEAGKAELEGLLALRGSSDGETLVKIGVDDTSLEAMMTPEVGVELMDILICPLSCLDASRQPCVSLARFARRPGASGEVRYGALVVCSAVAGEETTRFACDVGRALATTFMNEQFLEEVDRVPHEQPQAVLKAFDRYLDIMTIVPTVHIPQEIEPPSPAGIQESDRYDCLLSDSLVDGMERRICSPPLHASGKVSISRHSPPRHESPPPGWTHFFVEVDQLNEASRQWSVTRRLRQGLELDVDLGGELRPHLPHVSLSGLARVRDLVTPRSVALDVPAATPRAAMEAAGAQLGMAGLPQAAVDEISNALVSRALNGAVAPGEGEVPEATGAELIAPSADDEACVIMCIAHSQVPAQQPILCCFVRLQKPVEMTCSSLPTPTRFLLVLAGPPSASEELKEVGDSLAALAVDEELMGSLAKAQTVPDFTSAVEARLDALIFMPHAHVHHSHSYNSHHKPGSASRAMRRMSKDLESEPGGSESHGLKGHGANSHGLSGLHGQHAAEEVGELRRWARWTICKMQKYSIPLVLGVLIAIIWTNADEHSYHDMSHSVWVEGDLFGDKVPLSLHFIVNDIFMCFFFGLAIKEVTEAVLPGGSLSPITRAVNPLMATVGGIVGPIIVYVIFASIFDAAGSFDGMMCVQPAESGGDHRRLGAGGAAAGGPLEPCTTGMVLKGWGVPIATDISLAWMFALLIFGAGHPAINFLLLLAIVDDAIGMVIIAIFYGDPEKPVKPQWLLLVLLAMVCAGTLRVVLHKLNMQFWSLYVFLCGPIAWLGLYMAHVHPALALVFVIPFMPATATHSAGTHPHDGDRAHPTIQKVGQIANALPGTRPELRRNNTIIQKAANMLLKLESAPLHTFEHHLKLPVDLGMFFFGLANAGVKFGSVGGITGSVVIALLIGKTLGIAFFALLAMAMGFGLPAGINVGDLFSMAALGGVGLTVALFMANQAFIDPELQGQAKMGAVISILSALLSYCIRKLHRVCTGADKDTDSMIGQAAGDSDEDEEWLDDIVVDDLLQVLWTQRRYHARGTFMPIEKVARSMSKEPSRMSRRSVSKDQVMRASLPLGGSTPVAEGGPPQAFKDMGRGSVPEEEIPELAPELAFPAKGH